MMAGLVLRAVHHDDLPILFEHQRDPVAIRMAGYHPRSLEAFMEHWEKILLNPSVIKLAVVWDDEVVGNIVVFDVGENRAVGYWLGNAYWGKGIATSALNELLQRELQRPLFAYVAAHNVASRRVLEKCGFVTLGGVSTPEGFSPLDGEELLMRLD
ncbi:MAG: GNAT family N-acetyltransferase [Gammaproteobacteria bacterium]|nr:GNAT family N-acetyltransferase [Gammaproteobacteria bacterium]